MHPSNITMKVTCITVDVLAKLKANREQHTKIVVESRKAYVDKAKKLLEKRLGQLREGKIVSLDFHLCAPRDYTSTYDTTIEMLKMHQDKTISLTAIEVRQLIQDDWDWINDFLMTNAMYSTTSRDLALAKGLSIEEEENE